MRYLIITMLFSLFFSGITLSQSNDAESEVKVVNGIDTTQKVKKGSIFAGRPGKAALYSLILPGAGQIYSKSYWRVPFVYAAVGGMGYVLVRNTQQYKCFSEVYIARIDGVDPGTSQKCLNLGGQAIQSTEASTIRIYRDRANKNMQSSIIGFAAVWLANSIDAFVNAHLKEFDIDDDLSHLKNKPAFEIRPAFGTEYGGSTVGILVSF